MAPGFFRAPTNVFPCFPRRLWGGNPCIAQGHHGQTVKLSSNGLPKKKKAVHTKSETGNEKTASTVIDLFFIVCYCLLLFVIFESPIKNWTETVRVLQLLPRTAFVSLTN